MLHVLGRWRLAKHQLESWATSLEVGYLWVAHDPSLSLFSRWSNGATCFAQLLELTIYKDPSTPPHTRNPARPSPPSAPTAKTLSLVTPTGAWSVGVEDTLRLLTP